MMDFTAVCRTCLGTDSLSPIFSDSVDNTPYSAAILITMGVKVEKADGLPQQMCGHCIYYLNNCLAFRTKCKDAEAKLKEFQTKFHSDQNYGEIRIDIKKEFNCKEDIDVPNINGTESDVMSAIKVTAGQIDHPIKIEPYPMKLKKLHTKKIYERIRCTLCSKDLSVRSLDAHMAKCHPGADARRVKCELCERHIVREKMNRHVTMMHKQKRYQCEHCNSVYNTRKLMVDHMAACSKRKKINTISEKGREMTECEVCHKKMQRASLKHHTNVKHAGLGPVCENHERRHRGEKPFVCEACGARFHARYLLAQHRRAHAASRTAQCPACPASFKSPGALSAHARAAHGGVRVRCPLCARRYACRHYAVKHLRAVHALKGPIPPLEVVTEPNEV